MKKAFIFILLLQFYSCSAQDCKQLPYSFISYSSAISQVKSSSFKVMETANTAMSTWITSAKYYSCDGLTGYFIYTTNNGNEYIHQGVPVDIWEGFKNAGSKGSYYDNNIKGRYQLRLN